MPGALENFPFSLETDLANRVRNHVRAETTVTERSATMRTEVPHRDELVAKVKNADSLPATNRVDSALSRGDIADRPKDATSIDYVKRTGVVDILELDPDRPLLGRVIAHLVGLGAHRSRRA
jgi:hypothetical protein